MGHTYALTCQVMRTNEYDNPGKKLERDNWITIASRVTEEAVWVSYAEIVKSNPDQHYTVERVEETRTELEQPGIWELGDYTYFDGDIGSDPGDLIYHVVGIREGNAVVWWQDDNNPTAKPKGGEIGSMVRRHYKKVE